MEHPLARRALEHFDAIFPPDGGNQTAKVPQLSAESAPSDRPAPQPIIPPKNMRGIVVDQVS
jgi:hypothetical protein